ncbi:hypothetical protein PF006_g14315 [Phytophthora fragariae]|uniref:Uncharacterized protein n=1 Tax=Phytophthora fragariae TaxID=53985 RepID=A0A6A3TJ96_9STRA|nr:hypothetical protein PF006_g14315 [Phytophthora fragariae]
MWSTPNCSLCLILPFAAPQFHLSAIPASKDLVLAIVGSAYLFQAPNIIRSPVAVLARFYLAPAHLYQPRKSFKAPQRSYFTNFLLLLNFFGLRTIVAASKQRQFASVSPPLNLLSDISMKIVVCLITMISV